MDPGKQSEGFRGWEVKGGGSWVMGVKEGTCYDEYWVLYANNESLNTNSKTNDVLYSD